MLVVHKVLPFDKYENTFREMKTWGGGMTDLLCKHATRGRELPGSEDTGLCLWLANGFKAGGKCYCKTER